MKNVVWLVLLAGLVGCSNSDDDNGGTNDTTPTCEAALTELMSPVDAVSSGAVTILSDEGGVKTIFVDATAGGMQSASTNPRVYVNLETGARVDVTDLAATTSTGWDLALKRATVFTNSGTGGDGDGGAVFLAGTAFEQVTSADAGDKTFVTETFVDAECNPQLDETDAVKTSFGTWYAYDPSSHRLSPAEGTWLVKGGNGSLYKVAIASYYANPDGTDGETGARFVLKVAGL